MTQLGLIWELFCKKRFPRTLSKKLSLMKPLKAFDKALKDDLPINVQKKACQDALKAIDKNWKVLKTEDAAMEKKDEKSYKKYEKTFSNAYKMCNHASVEVHEFMKDIKTRESVSKNLRNALVKAHQKLVNLRKLKDNVTNEMMTPVYMHEVKDIGEVLNTYARTAKRNPAKNKAVNQAIQRYAVMCKHADAKDKKNDFAGMCESLTKDLPNVVKVCAENKL